MKKVCIVFGTRPEAIKLAPVIAAFKNASKAQPKIQLRICVTGQHREMLDQVLMLFDITPDVDLSVMRPGQDLTDLTAGILFGMRQVYRDIKPDLVLVQGDTTTTLAASLAAYYEKLPVGHVEAGLRTRDPYAPWPEELNRRLTTHISALHFAPTRRAYLNLRAEGIPTRSIHITGNTIIDSLKDIVKRISASPTTKSRLDEQFSYLDSKKRLILVTSHRRETFGGGIARVCDAVVRLSRREDVEIVFPVHLNPNIRRIAGARLNGRANIYLIEPLEYLEFVYLMSRSYVILTDSGGIQEEAPSLGKPVLVLRDTTERPEAVSARTVKLVGTDCARIVAETAKLLTNRAEYLRMSRAHNPYGDGRAADRIVRQCLRFLEGE